MTKKSSHNSNMYNHLTVAGTFDHFHKGHRYLLELALEKGKKVSIGITEQEMTKGKILSEAIEHLDVRKKNVQTFIKEINASERVTIFILRDIFGIAREDNTLDSIYVTEDTLPNAEKINEYRKENRLSPMVILTAPLLEGEDGKIIRSSRIRMGQIDREGNSYEDIFKQQTLFTAPDLVRDELRDPIDEVIRGDEDRWEEAGHQILLKIREVRPSFIITVGDVVTHTLQRLDFEPDVSFVDHKSRRKVLDITHTAVHNHGPYENNPGTIKSSIALKFAEIIPDVIKTKDHHQIVIEGEEDMMGLVAILLAPLKAMVLYGQFDQGIVAVSIDEEKKQYALNTLKRFI